MRRAPIWSLSLDRGVKEEMGGQTFWPAPPGPPRIVVTQEIRYFGVGGMSGAIKPVLARNGKRVEGGSVSMNLETVSKSNIRSLTRSLRSLARSSVR